jgi:hypothetical protein
MRIALAAAALFALSLAACGQRSGGDLRNELGNRSGLPTPGERPANDPGSDQAFRQSYRTINIATCVNGARQQGGAAVASVDFRPYCTCFIDRSMAGLSVDQLTSLRPGPREERIADQCAREHLGEERAAIAAEAGDEPAGNGSGGK